MMRKLNIFAVAGMLVTFLIHAILGALQITGAGSTALKPVAWVSVGFVAVHMILSTVLTVQTLHARHMSHAGYFRDNKLFWVRRISGFLIVIPLIMHLLIFSPANAGAYRVHVFSTGRLVSQILLVLAIALHVISNIRPALITCGIRSLKAYAVDILLVLSVLLLLFIIAFVVYYVRWMAV